MYLWLPVLLLLGLRISADAEQSGPPKHRIAREPLQFCATAAHGEQDFQNLLQTRHGHKAADVIVRNNKVDAAQHDTSDQKPGSLPVSLADRFHLHSLSNNTADQLVDSFAQGSTLLKEHSKQAYWLVNQSAHHAALGGAHFLHKAHSMVDPNHIQVRGPLKTQAQHHVANKPYGSNIEGIAVPRPELKTVEPFTGHVSIFQNDRLVLTVVCFGLILWSSFVSMHHKAQKGMSSEDPNSEHGLQPGKMLSVEESTTTTFSSIMNMGLLSMPYAMSVAGVIGAPIILFFVVCSAYTAHLMAWAFNSEIQNAQKSTNLGWGWGSIVAAAFGKKAGCAVNIFLVVELWGYLLSSVVATGMNLNQLVEEVSMNSAIAMSVLGLCVLSSAPVRVISQINSAANILFCIVCGMFVVTGFLLPAKAPSSDIQYVKPHGILEAAGIIVFSPAAHSIFPAIMQRTEDRQKFPQILRRSYLGAGVIYITFAVMGYYLFGNASQPSAVKNIGVDLHLRPIPNMGWMNTVAAFCMVVKIGATQPFVILPLTSTVQGFLKGTVNDALSAAVAQPMVLAITAVVAMHFANEMASLLNVVGSVFCMNIAFVFPVLCYWKLSKGHISCFQKFFFGGLIAMGLSFAVLGVVSALDF